VEAKAAGEVASVIMEFSTLHNFPRTSPADGIISHHRTDRHDTCYQQTTNASHRW
jgi:hypothetical protein